VCVAVAGACFMVWRPQPATAAAITQPSTNPFDVPVAISGGPEPVTVQATGFAPNSLVYVEQCDGTAPSTPQWSPTAHCDLGSSPSPAIADSRGRAAFLSTDPNHAFRPFVGESPQSLFNCRAPARRPPANGLANFAKCNLRVSTSNTSVTSDQVFVDMSFRTSITPTPTNARGASTTKQEAQSSNPAASTVGSGKRSQIGGTPAAGSSAVPSRVAVVAAPRHPKSGLLSLSDVTLVTGYIFVVGGFLMTAFAIARRRRPTPPIPLMTGTQTHGER
jgi:hypothetical protein